MNKEKKKQVVQKMESILRRIGDRGEEIRKFKKIIKSNRGKTSMGYFRNLKDGAERSLFNLRKKLQKLENELKNP